MEDYEYHRGVGSVMPDAGILTINPTTEDHSWLNEEEKLDEENVYYPLT